MDKLLTLVERGICATKFIEAVLADIGIQHDDTAGGLSEVPREHWNIFFANHTATRGKYSLEWSFRLWDGVQTDLGYAVVCVVRLSLDDDTGGLRYLREARYDADADRWVILPERLLADFGTDFTGLPEGCAYASPKEFHEFLVALAKQYQFSESEGNVAFEA